MENIKSLDKSVVTRLEAYASQYETAAFLTGDPSWFMHQVEGTRNQEVMAFIASCLSFGTRKLFMPKVDYMLKASQGNIYRWVAEGLFRDYIGESDHCYYRFYTYKDIHWFLQALQSLLRDYGSIGHFARYAVANREPSQTDVMAVLLSLSGYFQQRAIKGLVPKPVSSLCKRPCMFLRWMVRDHSPVDLGLWSGFVDKRHLLVPMDTHVFSMAQQLGLISQKSPTWNAVRQLTEVLSTVFPDDPLKGDFALFGAGVNGKA